jgi:hypothetical protein
MADDDIQAAKKRAEQLLDIPGVSGVGIKKKINPGNSVRIYVENLTPEITGALPEKIDGFPVDVVQSGKIKLFEQTGRYRPAYGGVSIGHPAITAGTLGSVVYDAATRRKLILSNSHVIAPLGKASYGDPILQPGVYDGGTYNDIIALLERWAPLYGNEGNLVDCAVAAPINDSDVSLDIAGIGTPTEEIVEAPTEGLGVMKCGRTTGITMGSVIDTDATLNVYLTPDYPIKFTDQIVTSHMAEAGDSGSLLMDAQRRPVGLLFAGSENLTLANKITNVMAALGVDFGKPYNLAAPAGASAGVGIPILAGLLLAPIMILTLRK